MPKPLFAKLVAVAAIGFLCLLGGSVYGLSTGDRILLMLSILIGACSLIRFLLLLRDIRSGSYYVLFGTCVKREPSLFKKSQQITFKSDEGKELIIPGLFEPPVRTLRATIPENESHIFR